MILAWAVLATVFAGQVPADSGTVAISHVTIVDVESGALRPDATVLLRAGRIARIGDARAMPVPKGARVVEGRGRYLIPGLNDDMVHLSLTRVSALPLLVANGVTSAVDLGGDLQEIDDWRTRIAVGTQVGPRILRAGPIVNGRKFNDVQLECGGPEQARGVVRTLKKVGVDVIKVHRRVPRDSYFAILDEARKQGLQVVGHIPMTVHPEEASDSGQVIFTHTETLFEGTFSASLKESTLAEAIRRFRAGAADTLFARMARNHTAEIPTLGGYRSIFETSDSTTQPDPNIRYVARSAREATAKMFKQASPEELTGLKDTFAEFLKVVGQMNRDGVTLLAGTDIAGTRIPGFSLHDELALLVESGLTPLQALQAATLTPARIWGRAAESGTVTEGKVADLVLLDANPLESIRNTRRISAVFLGGRVFRAPDLRRLLDQAERLAREN